MGSFSASLAQKSPQIYNSLFVGWQIKGNLFLRNNLSYNFLYLDPSVWNEIDVSSTLAKSYKDILEGTAGLYFARVQQDLELSNRELRPVLGFRVFNRSGRRYSLSNYSRFEFRYLFYSDNVNDGTARFRNRTTVAISLNRAQLALPDNNLFLFSYFEAFHNFEADTRERFFKQFKLKLGTGYRFNTNWAIDIGVIYLDSENNLGQASQLPTVVDTNYIFEWQLGYRISNE